MKDHRQGNDLAVLWSILRDGEPFDLGGRSLKLYLKNMYERREVTDFSVEGNQIRWTFFGKDQKNTGRYSLILVANEGVEGMITTDACDFVRLVSCSCKAQNGEDECNVQTEAIELTSTLEYVAGGGSYDDTEIREELAEKAGRDELAVTKSVGVGSAVQTKEVESFVDEAPLSPTTGQDIPVEASGDYSVVLNGKSRATAKRAMAQGNRTIAQGENSHTEGHCTQVVNLDETNNGYAAHAEGYGTIAVGTYSHAEGNKSVTGGANSHAEGVGCKTELVAEGAHAEGYETSADATASHSEGNNTQTKGSYSHSEGRQTIAKGEASHSEGDSSVASGGYSHSEGRIAQAIGEASHAEGNNTRAIGEASHAEGNNTETNGLYSHAEGLGTKTKEGIIGQHAEGYYNAETDSVLVVGCGTSDEDRKNALEVTQDGRIFAKGLGNYDGISLEASDLKAVIDSKANSSDVYNKTELNNRINADLVQKVQVATINGQSLINGGNIETAGGESSVFEAVYGETTYEEILEAYKAGKHCLCVRDSIIHNLVSISDGVNAIFTCVRQIYAYTIQCTTTSRWSNTLFTIQDVSNKTKAISDASTDAQYPSAKAVVTYVDNAIAEAITTTLNTEV